MPVAFIGKNYAARTRTAARTESQLNKQAKHTKFYKFSERISIAEHWKLVAESSDFHLTLSRAHLELIFSNSKYARKRDILSQKRESGMTLKKREFTPESGTVDTYETTRSFRGRVRPTWGLKG